MASTIGVLSIVATRMASGSSWTPGTGGGSCGWVKRCRTAMRITSSASPFDTCHCAHVLATQVTGGQLQGISRVWAAAVRSPKDNSLTLLIVNDADQPWTTTRSRGLAEETFGSLLPTQCQSREDADLSACGC